MTKTLLLLFSGFALMFTSCSKQPAQKDITGLWKSRDQHSDKPRSLVAVYKYHDMYYGRMLATYDDNGNIQDSIVNPKDRAKGVVGHPFYCGMDFIYDIKRDPDSSDKEIHYDGKIIDPEAGEVYNAEFWLEGENILIVRGKLWIFGKNIPWHKASKEDLPKGFSMSEISKFVPVVPKAI
jgi:uncharacterized protein (DUF2147 family)